MAMSPWRLAGSSCRQRHIPSHCKSAVVPTNASWLALRKNRLPLPPWWRGDSVPISLSLMNMDPASWCPQSGDFQAVQGHGAGGGLVASSGRVRGPRMAGSNAVKAVGSAIGAGGAGGADGAGGAGSVSGASPTGAGAIFAFGAGRGPRGGEAAAEVGPVGGSIRGRGDPGVGFGT